MRKTILMLFSAMALLSQQAKADKVQELTVNGEQVSAVLTQITFEGDNAVLHFDNYELKADMSTVVLSFVEASAIHQLKAFTITTPADHTLKVEGIAKGTTLEIYDTAGRKAASSLSEEIDISALPAGVYILKAGSNVVKFHKK